MSDFVPRTMEDLLAEWPPELDHFSASSAKMAVRCAEQWRQRYVLGIKKPPSLKMIAGGADHKAIEKSMVQKIESHVDLPVAEVRDAYVAEVERRVDESGGIGELEWRDDVNTDTARVREYDAVRTDGQGVVSLYHNTVSPFLQPLTVEEKFEVDVPGVPVKMIGYIDLIADPVIGATMMIDRKRVTKRSYNLQAEWTIQAEVYQLVRPIPMDFHLSVTTKNPSILTGMDDNRLQLQVPSRARTERLVQQIVAGIGFNYMKYGPYEPWPANGRLHTWACNYCGYRDGCWAWAP